MTGLKFLRKCEMLPVIKWKLKTPVFHLNILDTFMTFITFEYFIMLNDSFKWNIYKVSITIILMYRLKCNSFKTIPFVSVSPWSAYLQVYFSLNQADCFWEIPQWEFWKRFKGTGSQNLDVQLQDKIMEVFL